MIIDNLKADGAHFFRKPIFAPQMVKINTDDDDDDDDDDDNDNDYFFLDLVLNKSSYY